MLRSPVALASLSIAALLVAASALSQTKAAPTLNGTVGPSFSIRLTQNGKPVTSLKAGSYQLVVADKAAVHNFVLEKTKGKFEQVITTVPFTGTKTVTVKLTAGKWEVYCKPHESAMHADFTVV